MARITIFAEPPPNGSSPPDTPVPHLRKRESADSLIEDLLALQLGNKDAPEDSPVYDESRPRRSPRKPPPRRRPVLYSAIPSDNDVEQAQDVQDPNYLVFDDSDTDLSGFIVHDSADDEELRRAWDKQDSSSTDASSVSEKPVMRPNRRLVRRKDLVKHGSAEGDCLVQTNPEDGFTYDSHHSVHSDGDKRSSCPLTPSPIFDHSSTSDGEQTPLTPTEVIIVPSTPQEPALLSPSKLARIPQSPHRPSEGAFWSVEEVNTWNETHSPRKNLDTNRFRRPCWDSDSDLEDDSTNSLPLRSPLHRIATAALRDTDSDSSSSDMGKRSKKHNSRFASVQYEFSRTKSTLAINFLKELDQRVSGGRLAQKAAPVGGVRIEWSKTLNKTAGKARWGRHPTSQPVITLATKVITDVSRLRNTLAHEFCHLVNKNISNVWNKPHGASFKEWGRRVEAAFPEFSLHITTTHSYDIHFRYVWECSHCKWTHGRHSKSVDPARQHCGRCRGELVQIKPPPRKTQDTPAKNPEPTGWQTFLKANFAAVQRQNPKAPWGDIVKLVGEQYRATRREVSEENALEAMPDMLGTHIVVSPGSNSGE